MAPGDHLQITVGAGGGCGSFAGGQLDEGRAITEAWMLRVEHAYSGLAVVDAGDERVDVILEKGSASRRRGHPTASIVVTSREAT